MTRTEQNPTRQLIDTMIGHAPLTSRASDDLAWLQAPTTYRRLPVTHGSAIPWEAVLLSPAADNYQVAEAIEYRGLIDSKTITRKTFSPSSAMDHRLFLVWHGK